MAHYDFKLGEWFKQVSKKEEELKAKKETGSLPPQTEAQRITATERKAEVVEVGAPAVEAPASAMSAAETREVFADIAVLERREPSTGTPRAIGNRPDKPSTLFDDSEIPPVEDFLSFLDRSPRNEPSLSEQMPPVREEPAERKLEHLSEGTGSPRPVVYNQRPMHRRFPIGQLSPN